MDALPVPTYATTYAPTVDTSTLTIPVATTVGELTTTTPNIHARARAAMEEIDQTNAELAPIFKKTRENWSVIGQGLNELKAECTTPSGGLNKTLFGKRCREEGYDRIDRRRRADAMWLDDHWADVHSMDINGYNCPSNLRQAYNAHINGPKDTTADADDEDDTDTADTPEPTKAIEGPKESDPVEA